VELFTPACDGGDVDACVSLSMAIEHGDGAPKDVARARRIYASGLEADGRCREDGDVLACATLSGGAVLDGSPGLMMGSPPDSLGPARAALTRACDLDVGTACGMLALIERDHADALHDKACRLGQRLSCSARSSPHATELAKADCDLGDGDACA